MTDFRDQHLDRVDFTGATITSSRLHNVTMKGVELVNVKIHGDVMNVIVNGVDIAPLIEAEPQLASTVTQMADGWPRIEAFPFKHCVGTW